MSRIELAPEIGDDFDRILGYVALYRYVPELDTAFVLAIRGQKEAGYPET